MTAREIVEALRGKHRLPLWVFLPEVRVGTGYGTEAEPRLDAWAINCWPSTGLERVAYEVKVTREDFRRELRSAGKRRHALRFSNRFYFAAPAGLIQPRELPAEAGLLEVDDKGATRVRVEAPFRDSLPPTWRFLASVLRTGVGGKEQGISWASCLVRALVKEVERLAGLVSIHAPAAAAPAESEKLERLLQYARRFMEEKGATE